MLVSSSFCLRPASSSASSVCLRTTSWVASASASGPDCAARACGRRGLRLGLGAPQRHVPRGVDLDLLGLGLADGGLLVGGRLRHAGVPFATGRLLLADQLHVAGFVADRLDRERVDLQARGREVATGGVLDGLLELLAVEVELLDGQRPDDRTERALEDVLDDRVDLVVACLEEAFGRVADGLVVGADLEGGDALDGDLDALPGDGVREVDVDLASGQLELADLVDQGQDDDAAAADDLEALAAVGALVPLAADDQCLVGAGDLVAAADVRHDQDDDDDDEEDRDHPAPDEREDVRHGRSFPPGSCPR